MPYPVQLILPAVAFWIFIALTTEGLAWVYGHRMRKGDPPGRVWMVSAKGGLVLIIAGVLLFCLWGPLLLSGLKG